MTRKITFLVILNKVPNGVPQDPIGDLKSPHFDSPGDYVTLLWKRFDWKLQVRFPAAAFFFLNDFLAQGVSPIKKIFLNKFLSNQTFILHVLEEKI